MNSLKAGLINLTSKLPFGVSILDDKKKEECIVSCQRVCVKGNLHSLLPSQFCNSYVVCGIYSSLVKGQTVYTLSIGSIKVPLVASMSLLPNYSQILSHIQNDGWTLIFSNKEKKQVELKFTNEKQFLKWHLVCSEVISELSLTQSVVPLNNGSLSLKKMEGALQKSYSLFPPKHHFPLLHHVTKIYQLKKDMNEIIHQLDLNLYSISLEEFQSFLERLEEEQILIKDPQYSLLKEWEKSVCPQRDIDQLFPAHRTNQSEFQDISLDNYRSVSGTKYPENNGNNMFCFENIRRKSLSPLNRNLYSFPTPPAYFPSSTQGKFSGSNQSIQVAPLIGAEDDTSKMFEEHDPYWDLRSPKSRQSLSPFSLYTHNSKRLQKDKTPTTPLEKFLIETKEKLQIQISSRKNSPIRSTSRSNSFFLKSPTSTSFQAPAAAENATTRTLTETNCIEENIQEILDQHSQGVTPDELMEDIIEILSQIDSTISVEEFSLSTKNSKRSKRSSKSMKKQNDIENIHPNVQAPCDSGSLLTATTKSSLTSSSSSSSNTLSTLSSDNQQYLSKGYTYREIEQINEILELLSQLTNEFDIRNPPLPICFSPSKIPYASPFRNKENSQPIPLTSIQLPVSSGSSSSMNYFSQSTCSSLTNDPFFDQTLSCNAKASSPCRVTLHDYYFQEEVKYSPEKLPVWSLPSKYSNRSFSSSSRSFVNEKIANVTTPAVRQSFMSHGTSTSKQTINHKDIGSVSSHQSSVLSQRSKNNWSIHNGQDFDRMISHFRDVFADSAGKKPNLISSPASQMSPFKLKVSPLRERMLDHPQYKLVDFEEEEELDYELQLDSQITLQTTYPLKGRDVACFILVICMIMAGLIYTGKLVFPTDHSNVIPNAVPKISERPFSATRSTSSTAKFFQSFSPDTCSPWIFLDSSQEPMSSRMSIKNHHFLIVPFRHVRNKMPEQPSRMRKFIEEAEASSEETVPPLPIDHTEELPSSIEQSSPSHGIFQQWIHRLELPLNSFLRIVSLMPLDG